MGVQLTISKNHFIDRKLNYGEGEALFSEMVSDHIPDEVTGIPGHSPFRNCKSPLGTEEVSAQSKNRKHFSCAAGLH